MKRWIIKAKRRVGASLELVTRVYGRGQADVRESDLNDDWILDHGYRSIAAAKSGLNVLPWRSRHPASRTDAVIEEVEVKESDLRYEIHRCYEIVIVDREGNEIGNCDYCYGSRADAEAMAAHALKIAKTE